MQPLTTPPAGTLIELGSQNTDLVGIPILQGACPLEDNSIFLWVALVYVHNFVMCD